MNNIIEITIKDKIARQINKTLYICGNTDFVVNFAFDAEWNEFSYKTARFIHSAGYTDVVFEGNQCPVPKISNTHNMKVGVFAGDLRTTTPAHVGAKNSILCGSGVPAPPSDDVYNQIMDAQNHLAERVKALEQNEPVPDPGENTPTTGGTGLSETAAMLLLTILQNGIFITDQSDNINALAKELGVELGDDPGEEPDEPVVPDEPDEPDVPVITKLDAPVIRLETVAEPEPDEPDASETTPAILGSAILGRTILGDYGGNLPKLTAPVIQLITDSEPGESETPKLSAPVIRLETVTDTEPEEPEKPDEPEVPDVPKLTAPEIYLEIIKPEEPVIVKLAAPIIELVEV